MIRIETKAGHGANKPTSKIVSIQIPFQDENTFCLIPRPWIVQIDEHSDVFAFLARALNLEFQFWKLEDAINVTQFVLFVRYAAPYLSRLVVLTLAFWVVQLSKKWYQLNPPSCGPVFPDSAVETRSIIHQINRICLVTELLFLNRIYKLGIWTCRVTARAAIPCWRLSV